MANEYENEAGRETRRVRLADLTPHAGQRDYFGDLADEDLAALANDIRRNGLRERVEVTPDLGIVSGHQRVRAMRRLGRDEAEVVVRHDLAAAGPAAVERAFLEANQHRRQLGRLGRARVALRLFEIERGRGPGDLRPGEDREARERVGRAVGRTGRTLSRYLRVLRTPPEVQAAFDAGRMRLVDAERVAALPAATQALIARRVRNGHAPGAVVANAVAAGAERCERLLGLYRERDDLTRLLRETGEAVVAALPPLTPLRGAAGRAVLLGLGEPIIDRMHAVTAELRADEERLSGAG